MEFPLLFIINFLLPCCIPSRNLWVPFKRGGALSTYFRVQKCTQFIRALLLGPLMKILVILVGYKYPTLYMFPKDVNISSVPNIYHITQHPLMHMLLTWMTPSVSLTIIAITWFGVVVDSFCTVPIDKKKNHSTECAWLHCVH